MAKYYGMIGYAHEEETSPGVHKLIVTERPYYGEVTRIMKRNENGEGLNDNLTINNEISIVADPYAYEHFHNIVYIQWYGAKWHVNSIDVQRPRLIMTVGGVYNGPEPD